MRHADGSMYPLGNLRQHGATRTDHARSMDFWIAEQDGAIFGTVGVSREGYVFPQVPEPNPMIAKAVRSAIAGRDLMGVIGPMAQVHWLLANLGLDGIPVRRLGDEPHYALDLVQLIQPGTDGLRLIRIDERRRELVTDWRTEFIQEVIGLAPDAARAKAVADVDGILAKDTHRVLLRNGAPAAFTGINAELPEIVQVGGVYTPPKSRRQGFARAAVAMHLSEARAAGVRRGVLSAASEAAARAYHAIGFRRIGDFSMNLFDGPQKVRL